MTIAKYLSSAEFHELNRIDDSRAAIDLLLRAGLAVSLLMAWMLNFHSYPVIAILGWYLYSVQLSFWGYAGLGHEAFHKRVFSRKEINTWLFTFCSAITWSNGAFFEKSHLYHHKNTFAENDTEAHSEQAWSLRNLIAYALIDFRLMKRRVLYAFMNAMGYFPNLKKIPDAGIVTSARWILAVNAVLLLLVFIITESFLITTLVFLSPFTGTLLNKFLAKAQHHDLEPFKSEGPLAHSRTLILPKILGFLYANMNYHAEHHLAPSIPYYNLPRLHKILRERGYTIPCSLRGFAADWLAQSGVFKRASS